MQRRFNRYIFEHIGSALLNAHYKCYWTLGFIRTITQNSTHILLIDDTDAFVVIVSFYNIFGQQSVQTNKIN